MELRGYVYNQAGAAKVGLTAELWEVGGGAATNSTVTNANGMWEFTGISAIKLWQVKIIDGLKVLWLDGRNAMQLDWLVITDTVISNTVATDTIAEKTAATGVTVDGLLCKDSKIPLSAIPPGTLGYVLTGQGAGAPIWAATILHTYTELYQLLPDPPQYNVWTDTDLSAYIPVGTKAVEILALGAAVVSFAALVGCRTNGSALARRAGVSGYGGGVNMEYGSATMTCYVGNDRIIELYILPSSEIIDFYLIGYWI